MAETNKQTLKEKKKNLETELRNIQDELDESLDRVKSDVTNSLDPLRYVRRHPLPMVGISVVVGFLAAKEGGKDHKRRSRRSASRSDEDSSSDKLTSTLWYEMKRLATRKALAFAGSYLEDLFADD